MKDFGGPIGAVLWTLVALGALFVPLVFARNPYDAFREPKLLFYETQAILCLAAMLVGVVFRGRDFVAPLRRHRAILVVVLAAVVWTAVATLTSTNRTLSAVTFQWVAACAIVFVATLLVGSYRRGGMLLAGVALVPALVNGAFAVLQRADVYNPMQYEQRTQQSMRLKTTALIGDPNTIAAYLVIPALAALAMAVVAERKQLRVAAGVLAALLAGGIVLTETLTSLAALGAGVAAMAMLRWRRRALAALALLAVIGAIIVFSYRPLLTRAVTIREQYRQGNYMALLSLRTPAFAAAWEMFKDRPLVGQGPGTFGWWYLPYKLELNERSPHVRRVAWNFGETHNDHLQTLAVSGLPGYAIFVAALLLLGRVTLRRDRGEVADDGVDGDLELRTRVGRMLALPLAVAFAVLALAYFPLEVAPVAGVILHFAALSCAWGTAEA